MMDMQFRLFGKPEIWHGKHQIEDFNTHKTQALLLYLIAEGCEQNRNDLARFFWDDFNLISSQNNLRTALHHLRRDFEPCLAVDRQSVCFRLPGSAYLDLAVIDAVSQDADKQTLAAAADAYRGEFLEGFNTPIPAFEAWKERKQAHYRQLIIIHLLRLASLYENAHQLSKGLAVTQRLLDIQPLNEATILMRMRFFANLGQREQAIQVYQYYLHCLQQLPNALPSHLIESYYDNLEAGLTRQTISHLPHKLTSFFGREVETALLSNQLIDPTHRLVNLVGHRGTGKTRLAIRCAELVEADFRDGVHYVDLHGIDANDAELSIDAVSKLVLYNLHAKIVLYQSYFSQLIDTLRNLETLLILDNFGSLDWRERFVAEIIQQAPNIHLLVISRQTANISGATVMNLKGLAYPTADDLPSTFDPNFIYAFPSLQLFIDRAQRVQPGFKIDENNYHHIARFCELVQGLPYGIEFIANLLRSASLNELITAVRGETFKEPNSSDNAVIPEDLEIVLDYIWANLPPKTQDIALACTLFKGGFSKDAFNALIQESPDTLPSLVSSSMILDIAHERYAMHDLFHIFLQKKQTRLPVEYPARYSTYFLSWLIKLDDDAATDLYPIEKVRVNYSNLIHAWGLALAQGQYELLAEACAPLSRAFEHLGMVEAGLTHFSDTITQLGDHHDGSDLQKRALGGVLLEAARLALECGRVTAAHAMINKAQDIAQALNDPTLLAGVLQRKAAISIQAGDDQPVTKLAYEGLTQAVKSGHPRLVASGITVLGEAYCKQHQYQKARKLFKTAFDEHLVEDDSRMMQTLLLKLSQCEKEQGYFNISMGINRRAQRLNQNFQNLSEEALLAFTRGECQKYLGHLGPAFDEFQQAHDTFATINHPGWQARSLANLGILHFWQGDYDQAMDQLDAAETTAKENQLLLPEILALKARVQLASDQNDPARACLQEISTFQDPPSPYMSSTRIDMALAEEDVDTTYQMAVSILPKIKDLSFDSLDDPFCVYLSISRALINMADPAAAYVLAHAQREFTRLTKLLQSTEAKAAFLSIPHRTELFEIIQNQNNQHT